MNAISGHSTTTTSTTASPGAISTHHMSLHKQSIHERRPIIEVTFPNIEDDQVVTLTIFGLERDGLLADITNFLQSIKLNVRQATIYTFPKNAIMDCFTLHDPLNILKDDISLQRIHDSLVDLVRSPPPRKIQKSTSTVHPSPSHPPLHNSMRPLPTIHHEPHHHRPISRRYSSNITLTDLEEEHRQEREAARLKSEAVTANFVDHALSTLITGEYLYYYSSGTRYRYRFEVSEDRAYLSWGESRIVRLSRYAGCAFGAQSPTFHRLGRSHLIDPEWLCFSLVANPPSFNNPPLPASHPPTIDLVCVSVDQLNRWLLGLQSLCSGSTSLKPTIIPVTKLTLDDITRQRVRYKIRAHANSRGLTPKQFILKRVRDMAIRQSSLDMDRSHVEEMRQLEKTLAHLRQTLIEYAGRETLLNTTIRDFQTSWEVDFENIEFLHPIGQGAFSEMWKALWRSTPVAVKKLTTRSIPEESSETYSKGFSPIPGKATSGNTVMQRVDEAKMSEEDRRLLHDFRLEVTMLNKLRHPNVVMFLGAVTTAPHMCIVTEFCDGGSLFSALRKKSWRTCLSLEDLRNVARHIARAFCYLHAMRIIHRDLKSQNLLLDRPVEEGCPVVKVADFGLSRNFIGIGTVTGSVAGVMTSETGTYRWMAPEMIRHEPYNEKVDVYSYGIVLWELFSCEIPFSGMTPIQAAFAVADKHLRPRCESEYAKHVWIPPAWQALIERCWHRSSHERPRFRDVLQILEEMENCSIEEIPPLLQKGRVDLSNGVSRVKRNAVHDHVTKADSVVGNGNLRNTELFDGHITTGVRTSGQTGLGRSGSSPSLPSSVL